ncbi:MAG TPA: DUF6111 family protein [Stellaceae bacterium]|nr:DUF6111 family protein [Stellaceae bacterium]
MLLTIIIPLLLPTALYVGWRLSVGRSASVPPGWLWLAAGALALASVALVLANTDFSGPREGKYVPPYVKNGVVVPGHFESGSGAPER